MNITKIISKVFDSRLKAIDLYDTQAGEIQHRVLTRLVKQAENTEWGKKYDYKSIRNYEDFKNRLPIQTYEEVKPYVERLRAGEQNLLWPSEIRWFASNHSLVGDLSAILIQNVSPLINLIRVPSKQIALMDEWEAKIEAIANSTIPVDVTNLSGVPSWMLVLIKRILEKTGKQTLEEVWPNLEVFFHGGVAFTPYREQYRQVIHSSKIRTMQW